MDTKHKPVGQAKREPGARRRHSLAFKRRLIEQTLVPGASVARIALDLQRVNQDENSASIRMRKKLRAERRRA